MQYYFDFRGRKYNTTAYFNEQGADLARSLLLVAEGKPLGSAGFFWLQTWLATTWGGTFGKTKTDKLTFKERSIWATDNEGILLSYAADPKTNRGWMGADKPWVFLAACLELYNLRRWQEIQVPVLGVSTYENYEYVCHMEVFVDGSTNGSQHLAALTRDQVTAPLVNLVPSDVPGDLYAYVAGHVWDILATEIADYTLTERKVLDATVDDIIFLKRRISKEDKKSELRAAYVEELVDYKADNEENVGLAAPFFWNRISDKKERRKILKRQRALVKFRELLGTPERDNQQPSLARESFEGSTTRIYHLEQMMKSILGKYLGSAKHPLG